MPETKNLESIAPQIVQNIEKLFRLAIEQRASDIHLEPQKKALFVRFRIDGVLRSVNEFPKEWQPSLISRVKILANMDITEKRLPQDGQINWNLDRRDIDLRVSTLPSKYGEKVVIRILDKSGLALGLEKLGFPPKMQSDFEMLTERSHGLLLVTGPTGSGKTTTLYSVLHRLKSPLKNLITLEDPIEYELLAGSDNEMGTTQVQVNPKIGFTFATGLRSVLRQDPDVIMVGEIRDKDTAEIAMKASMTGHLVLSTLHTNDAPSALNRLKDMGLEPYMIGTTVMAILAQRLVRILCEDCKEVYKIPERALKNIAPERRANKQATFFRPVGCNQCQGMGYKGRRAIFELMIMTDEIKNLFLADGNVGELKKAAMAQGMTTLRDNGMNLVLQGLTTIEEIFRSTVE